MKLLSSLSLIFLAGMSLAAPSSKTLLEKASSTAKHSGKNVLVIFHASWCGWCHRFDKFLDTTDEGKIVKNGLEIVHVTVMESDPKQKVNENAGGLELMEQLGGKDAGLPFFAIIDAKTGKPIANSLQKDGDPKSNTGYPGEPNEITHFIHMLEVGAKRVSSDDRMKVKAWLTANAPHS